MLVAAIQEQLPHVRVILDTAGIGDLRIANRRGCWPMARRAWLAASGDHHLVLEDDAVLCADFPARLADVVDRKPDAVISLFLGSRWCSVATVMPRAAIAPWLAWADHESRLRPHHDQLIDLGCTALGIEHVWCSPSLVDHADVPSLLGHPSVSAMRFNQPGPISFVRPDWV